MGKHFTSIIKKSVQIISIL